MNPDWREFRRGFQQGLCVFGPPAIAVFLIVVSWLFFTGYFTL